MTDIHAIVTRRRHSPTGLALVALLALLGSVIAAPAGAVHPGSNGPIVTMTQDPTTTGGFYDIVAIEADGSQRKLVDFNSIDAIAVSPDGLQIAYVLQRLLFLQPLDGTADDDVLLANIDESVRDIEWSPDGSEIAVMTGARIRIYPVAGGEPRDLAANEQDNDNFAYNQLVWTSANQLIAVELRGYTAFDPVTGARTFVEGDLNIQELGVDAGPAGDTLLFSCLISTDVSFRLVLCITDLQLNVLSTVDPGPDLEPGWAAFSPDGTQVVFRSDPLDDDGVLYRINVDSTGLTMLGPAGNAQNASEWAPLADPDAVPPPPPASNNVLDCTGFDGDAATTERADYADPTLYAVAVSQARFGCDGSDLASHVVLSRDDAFPDSLAGAALTGEGPLLFTATDSLSAETLQEVIRVLEPGGTVYLLGGTAAISQAVSDQLTGEGFAVERLAGGSRVETSVAIANEVLARYGPAGPTRADLTGGTIAIARAGGPADNPSAGWADSVTAGAWTAADRIPTLVTDTAGVHPAVAEFLELTQPDATVLLGGSAALSQAVEDAVPNPQRVSGASRAGTAAAIAVELVGEPTDGTREAIAINGFRDDGWLFGLPAAGLAADTQGSIALVTDPLPPETAAQLCSPGEVDVLLAGGLGVITDATGTAIDTAAAC